GRRARAHLRANAGEGTAAHCCPFYHEAVELIGRRWTGAILRVLMGGPLRFSEIAQAVPELSDRLLSERMKELEARGLVERRVLPGPPVRVEYQLTPMARELEPALSALKSWGRRWLRRKPQAEPAHQAARALAGSPTTGFNAIKESDRIAQPDPATFAILPWRPVEAGVGRMFCDVVTPERTPYEGDPRHVLRRALERAGSMGFDRFYVGPELE